MLFLPAEAAFREFRPSRPFRAAGPGGTRLPFCGPAQAAALKFVEIMEFYGISKKVLSTTAAADILIKYCAMRAERQRGNGIMDIALQIGQRIKDCRIAKGLTVKDLAAQAQITSSMLSQIERGQANLAEPMFRFFMDEVNVRNEVVRAGERRHIIEHGTEYELLAPDTNGLLEMLELTLAPGSRSCDQLLSHTGEEIALVQRGSIELILEDDTCLLHTGDSVRIKSGLKHCWHNPGQNVCVLVFAVSPPDF